MWSEREEICVGCFLRMLSHDGPWKNWVFTSIYICQFLFLSFYVVKYTSEFINQKHVKIYLLLIDQSGQQLETLKKIRESRSWLRIWANEEMVLIIPLVKLLIILLVMWVLVIVKPINFFHICGLLIINDIS